VTTDSPHQPLAFHSPLRGRLMNLLLVLAVALLVTGIFAPMLTLHQLWIFDHQVSLVSGLGDLWRDGRFLLFFLILVFSIIVPLLKILLLAAVWNLSPNDPRRRSRHLHLVHQYGKWSMLDVLVVAVLIVSVKLGSLARVEIHYGFYAFAAAVLLSMLITALSVQAAERR